MVVDVFDGSTSTKSILVNFYRATIESVLTFAVITWYGGLGEEDRRKFENIVCTCSRIVGSELPSIESLYISKMEKKMDNIMSDFYHPAFSLFKFLPSNKRLLSFKGSKRFVKSFYPSAVSHFNFKS